MLRLFTAWKAGNIERVYCDNHLHLFKSVFDNKTHKRIDFNHMQQFESCYLI